MYVVNLAPKKQWVVYLLWLFLLALVLAGIWWYYSHRIEKLDQQMQETGITLIADCSHPQINHLMI